RSDAVRSWRSGLVAGQPLIRRYEIARRNHAQRIDTPAVGARDAELETIDVGRLAAPGQPAELLHDETGHRVEALLLGELRAEILVELVDPRDPADRVLVVRLLADVLVVLDIELIVDLTDDLLDHILDRDQPRDAAVLIDDDRHVIAIA